MYFILQSLNMEAVTTMNSEVYALLKLFLHVHVPLKEN